MTKLNNSSGDGQLKTFRTFPEFSKLRLDDREQYEALIKGYPPISDISFPTLMLWWSHFDELSVAKLNGNLVLSYWLPGAEDWSGLSILGTKNLDESMCTVFDYLQERGEEPRLVHVSEFMLAHLEHPELFRFESQRSLDEYVIAISKFYPLTHLMSYRRYRVRRFLAKVDEERVRVRSVDLSVPANQQLLLDAVVRWPKKGTVNEVNVLAHEVLVRAIREAEAFDMENVCVFVDGKLHAFMLYHVPPADKHYAILCHIKFSYGLPHLFDYTLYALGRWFTEQGITHGNLNMDYNMPMLRMIKLALGPENYFRKYIVRPARSRA